MSDQVNVVIESLTLHIEAQKREVIHLRGVIEELNKVIAGLRYDKEEHVKPQKKAK
jgi:hypothetical protein